MSAKYSRSARLGLTAIACAVLAACGSLDGASGRIAGLVTPYKIEVVQGNFVSKEQVDALQRGMTRAQVKEVLGTPLMASVFHADRWDYVFTLKRQGVEPQSRKLALFFQGDQLDKWEGDTMPSEAEFVAQLDSRRKSTRVPLLEVPEEVLKEFNLKNPSAPRTESLVAVVAGAAAASYPPLEAPGTITQAWDASTQRAVVAAAAARPAPQALSLPQAISSAQPPVRALAPGTAPAPPAAAAIAVSPAAVAAAPVPAAAAARAPAAAPVPPASPVPAAAAVAAVTVTPTPPAAVVSPAPASATALPVTRGFVGLDSEVTAFLNGWMNDWQARDASAYLARYVPEFKGASATRAEWEAARSPAIENRRSVSIAVQDVRGVMIPPTGARVVFRQVYDSDAGSEIGTKALFLIKRDGRWLIEREFFTPAAR